MSLKNKVLKDVRRRAKRQKYEAYHQVAMEILMLPFWQRVKFAWRIVFRTKS